jgi:hypothetical protein
MASRTMDDVVINTAVNNFCEVNFQKKGQGGWFFTASGCYLMDGDTDVSDPPPLKNELATVESVSLDGNWAGRIRLSTALSSGQSVGSVLLRKDANSPWIEFQASDDPNDPLRTRIRVYAHDYEPQVDNPNTYELKALQDYGFAVTTQPTAPVKAYALGVWRFQGWSPAIGPGTRFQGRTMTFFSADLGLLAHELTHGLGMAHKCGHLDYTGGNLCLMLYPTYWLRNSNGSLTAPGGASQLGYWLCAEHIMAIRRAHLEDDSLGRHLGW